MTVSPKGTTVDTSNLQPGELIHVDFDFNNVIYIHGFTSVLTVVCAKTIIIWVLPIATKQAPVCIISFIIKTFNNEQHICKRVRLHEDGALTNSTDVTNLLVYEFKISMEITGGDASWLNVNN